MLNMPHQLLLTTCPNWEIANKLAQWLVEKHLAACVNIVPKIHSVYEWQGKIVSEEEWLLIIKTRHEHLPAIEKAFEQLHPYTIPELIAFTIDGGSSKYLNWLNEVITGNKPSS
jgi:periplasmic divalent cation tolerance protein